MKNLIALLATLVLLPQVFADSLSYSVVIDYSEGVFSLKDILLIKAAPNPVFKNGVYTAKIISFKDEVLFETSFNVNLEAFYSFPLSKETAKPPRKLTKTNFDLLLPYYTNAKSFQILKNNELLFETDLSKFSTCNENKVCDASESLESCPSDCTCGNNLCDENENYMSCSADCASGAKDNYCDKVFDQICDPDCSAKEDYDCRKEKAVLPMIIYVILGISIAAIVFFVYKRRIKKI